MAVVSVESSVRCISETGAHSFKPRFSYNLSAPIELLTRLPGFSIEAVEKFVNYNYLYDICETCGTVVGNVDSVTKKIHNTRDDAVRAIKV